MISPRTGQLTSDDDRYPARCPWTINAPPMRMRWEQLTLLHWRYPAEQVQALLPDGIFIETFDGDAWVGLVPFQMRVDVPGLPEMARILHFPETNVRTYVTGESGEPGVWFFSLEASSLPSVVTARAGYGVPYFWSDMSIITTPGTGPDAPDRTDGSSTSHESSGWPGAWGPGARLRYTTSRRRWPGPAGASSSVDVEVGRPFEPGESSPLDRFLTARWALYGTNLGMLTYSKMFHEPWPLHHATVHGWNDELVMAAGLEAPTGEPLVHYAPAVHVRCGWPARPPKA